MGDSAQGFANAVIFCFFTPRLRAWIKCCKTNDDGGGGDGDVKADSEMKASRKSNDHPGEIAGIKNKTEETRSETEETRDTASCNSSQQGVIIDKEVELHI